MKKRLAAFATVLALLLPLVPAEAAAAGRYGQHGFTEVKTQGTGEGTYHLLRHTDTGAQVVWLENGSETREFAIGFRTPPEDSKGANHVLEHSLLNGSEQYPLNDLMHILRNSSVAQELNAYTSEDYTTYVFRTEAEQDFYNLADIYTTCVLFPLLRSEPNIFKQQGIRIEYSDGKARYNGIVYSELRLKSLDTDQNSLDFVSDKLYENLYGDSPATFDSGGAIPELLDLTYEDVMWVYDTYYRPSNMLVYTAGKQDIGKTLKMLDGYLNKTDKGETPAVTIQAQPIAQAQIVQEYNVTGSTQTVDIGFMAHGPSILDTGKMEAWGAMLTCLQRQLGEAFPEALPYTVGGNAGGIYNVGVILSEVPVEQKDEVVSVFQKLLEDAAQNGFPTALLDEALDQQQKAQQFAREEVFMGFTYAGDPFACIDRSDVIADLRQDMSYFKSLAAEWRDSKFQTIVISGNGAAKHSIPEPRLDAAGLEQVKRDTEAFNAWLDQPDDPAVLAKLPTLDLNAFSEDPFSMEQTSQTTDGVTWYFNEATDTEAPAFSLYFPIELRQEEASVWCLLCEYLNDQFEEAGLSLYTGMSSGERYDAPDTLQPAFALGGGVEAGKAADAVQAAAELLRGQPLADAAAFRTFLTERRDSLRAQYRDPYYYEYSMMLQSSTQANRFMDRVPAGFVGSSMSYKAFIEEAAANEGGDAALLEQMRTLLERVLQRTGVVAEFTGSRADFEAFRRAAVAFVAALPAGTGISSCEWISGGWPSALVVSSNTQDANHVMLTGQFRTPPENMAVYDVLGPLLTAKYMLPELRDKRGAYGASLLFDANGVTMVSSGGVSVDEAVAVFRGAADYLRSMQLAPSELAGFQVNAVNTFDMDAEWSRVSGLGLARSGRTQADYAAERAAILSLTEDDLKACADELEAMVAQNRVFAQTTRAAGKNVQFPFAARVDAATGKVTPLLKTNIPRSDDTAPVTRGEAAVLLADSLTDQTAVEQPELARFADVSPDSAHAAALARLHDRGLLNGYADGSYQPDALLTRAEFCVIASTLSDSDSTAGAPVFTDVYQGYWAQAAIEKMAAQNILQGDGDGCFRPEEPITAQEITLILQRLSAINQGE